MKSLTCFLAVCAVSWGAAQTVKLPPLSHQAAPILNKPWKPGTADISAPVVPYRRSTYEKYPQFPSPVDPLPPHTWAGPRLDLPGKSAPEYADLAGAFGNDAPDYIFRYQGLSDTGQKPPDISSAVGPDYIVQAVNAKWSICDKGGRSIFETTVNAFTGDLQSVMTNPRVIYDPWHRRYVQLWCARQPSSSQTFLILIVSDDSDPFGNWNVFYFPATTGEVELAYPDDYDLGYGPTGLYAAGNQYTIFGNNFAVSCLRTWNKSQVYTGAASLVRTDELYANPDGSRVFAPRAAQMQAAPTGIDGMFVNSRAGGGNKLTIWKLSDPFGTHTITGSDVPVATYDLPVPGVEPSGSVIDTQDCRLMNCVVAPTLSGGLQMVTGSQESNLWFGDTELRAVAHFYVLNPTANALVWEGIFGLPFYSYWCASAACDFRESAMWVFARCGINSPAFGEARYVDFNQGVFSNMSKQLRNGEGSYNGFRWGDYLNASLDWTDYSGAGSKQKIWVAGEIARSLPNLWSTWLGAAAYNATPGTITVGPATNVYSEGPPGGPFTPNSFVYTLTNPGEVAYAYEITNVPAWLDVSSRYGEVPAGASRPITFNYNAQGFSLPIANYSGNISFKNLYSGNVVTRSVALKVQGYIFPSSTIVLQGFEFSGDLPQLRASDDTYMTFFNDDTLGCKVAFVGVCSISTAARMTVTVETSVARPGLSQSLQLFNYTTGQLVPFLGSLPGAQDDTKSVVLTTQIPNYIAPISKQMVAVLQWNPINDEDPAQDGWLHKVDYMSWNIIP